MEHATVGAAFWDNIHQRYLLEAIALENPREPDEGLLDYAERLAVEAGMMPLSSDLRERNRLRYADRIPKDAQRQLVPLRRVREHIEHVLEEDLVRPHMGGTRRTSGLSPPLTRARGRGRWRGTSARSSARVNTS